MPLMVGVSVSMRDTVPGKSRTGMDSGVRLVDLGPIVTSLIRRAQQVVGLASSRRNPSAEAEGPADPLLPSVTITL